MKDCNRRTMKHATIRASLIDGNKLSHTSSQGQGASPGAAASRAIRNLLRQKLLRQKKMLTARLELQIVTSSTFFRATD